MSTSVTTKPLRQVTDVRELLVNANAQQQLSMVAAKHMNPERMMRIMANAIRTTPQLQQADPMSLLGGLMQCAALGLEPNTVLGHAYLIPFKNNKKGITEVQLIVGYKGLIDLARRSGHITSIHAGIHYDDDPLWEYEEGTEARLRHQPGDQEGKKIHAYAIAKFKDGGHAYVVLPWKRVLKIRDGSQGWKTAVKYGKTASTPWGEHEDAMAAKTAVRALSKYLPLSVEFMEAVSVDADGGQRADFASFAMNPDQGVTIDGTSEPGEEAGEDGEFIEGEAEEKKPDPKAEDKPKAQARGAVKDKPASDTKADLFGGDAGDDKPADKKEPTQLERLAEKIINDLNDVDPDDVLQLYAPQLEEMEALDSKSHSRVMEEVDAFRKARDDK